MSGHVTRVPENDLRVELRCRNNVLYHAIFDVYGSVAEFCRAHHFVNSEVGRLLNLKASPLALRGNSDYRPMALRLAEATGFDPAYLFPADLYSGLIPPGAVAEVSSQRFVALRAAGPLALPAGQEDALIAKEMSAAIDAVLRTLTPKQEEVIRLRFGLGGGEDEQTFEEIGEQLGLSRARIQQIDSKAMRKLRHPTRSQRLRW